MLTTHVHCYLTSNSYIDVNRLTKGTISAVTEHGHFHFVSDADAQVSKHCVGEWIRDGDVSTRVTSGDVDHVNVTTPHSVSRRVAVPRARRGVLRVRNKQGHSRVVSAITKV